MTLAPAYRYRGSVSRILDGDTLELAVDVGFRIIVRDIFRLWGIDCPEIRTDAGLAARDYTALWCGARRSTGVIVETFKAHEKYGRWLARVLDTEGSQCLNDALVAAGHASVSIGGGGS